MKIRIAIIISSFYPIVGGSERQFFLIAKNLVQKGYEIDVFTRKYPKLSKYENIEGINIHRVSIGYLKKFNKVFFIKNTLINLIFKKKYNIVFSSQFGSCSYVANLYKNLFNINYIVRSTGKEAGELSKNNKGIKKFNMTCRNATKIIAINETIKKDLMKLCVKDEQICRIGNGVEKNKKIDPISNKNIVYCGRLEEIKGIDLLLEAWGKIENNFDNDVYLEILGDGKLGDYLKNKYRHLRKVKWIGTVYNSQKYIKKARILILPSRYEGVSNTLLEALSIGLPVIATKVGGNIEIINDNKNGVLTNIDVNEIKEAIVRLYYDEDLLSKLSNGAYDYIEKFNINNIVSKYELLIEEHKC